MSTYEINIQAAAVDKTAVKIGLFLQYVFNAADANVFVYIYDANGAELDTRVVYIPAAVYSTWTTDDAVIIDYVMDELNFTPAA